MLMGSPTQVHDKSERARRSEHLGGGNDEPTATLVLSSATHGVAQKSPVSGFLGGLVLLFEFYSCSVLFWYEEKEKLKLQNTSGCPHQWVGVRD